MTAIIDALEARGAVRRERHATDRRFITVSLTDAGRELLVNTAPARSDAIVDIMRELSGDQRVRLARLCRRLLRVLDPDQFKEPDDDTPDDTSDDTLDDTSDDHPDEPDAPSHNAPDTPAVATSLSSQS
jgi:MarR family 2-MHQ and catechol resistance regulon transcriptional repressor